MLNDLKGTGLPALRARGEALHGDEPPPVDLSAAHKRELRRAQLEQVLAGSVIAVIVHLLGASVLAMVLWPHVQHMEILRDVIDDVPKSIPAA